MPRPWSFASIIVLAFTASAAAAPTVAQGLAAEPQLHPLDAFTADTLRKGEVFYAQSPNTFPLPSWMWLGVTDWLTVEIDLLPLLGGLFVEPHLPVPSMDVRVRLLERSGSRPGVALESMVQYLYGTNQQSHGALVNVTREGLSWFTRVNVSQALGRSVTAHLSVGATFAKSITIENSHEGMQHRGRTFRDLISPDAAIALGWHVTPWLALFGTASYGTTFTYLDNVPRKLQATYGARIAPFLWSKRGWLRTLRVELASINMYFPDAEQRMAIPIPVFPYFYWQW